MDRRFEGTAPMHELWLPTASTPPRRFRNGLRLATASGELRGPDKYRLLDLRRRRAQIRARRALAL